ncbi:argininosuccinate lyase [soil metagenome]
MPVTKKKWGEKFVGNEKQIADFNSPFIYDRRLFASDIICSIAYCDGLFHAGVLTRLECEKLKNGLSTLLKRADFDHNYFDNTSANDIHSFIETKLVQLVGETGRKIQIGRSRNDQISTAFRFWLRREIDEISKICANFQMVLVEKAENHREAVLPAYSDLRKVQPILWAHWCLAYFEMFSRDRDRLDEVWRRTNILPLGSDEMAGSNFEIDRELIAKHLGFEGVTANSLDAASDFDFAVEFAGTISLMMIHLSRFAEDLMLFSSEEFKFIELDEANVLHLESRQNLNSLELIRGKSGRIFGHQTALLTTLKGLQLGDYKDVQVIREAVYDICETVKSCLQIASIVFEDLRINEENSKNAVENSYLNANELNDYLLQKGISILTAKEMTQKIVLKAISNHKKLTEINLEDFRRFSPLIEDDIFEFLSLQQNLHRKNQIGGTSPERVFEALAEAKNSLENE